MFRLILPGFCLLSAPPAYCQPAVVTTEFMTYAPGGLPPGFTGFYQTNGIIQQFYASSTSLGLPISYRGPQTFDLRASKEDFATPPEGQEPKPPLATVTLPANADNLLLLCSTGPDGKVRLSAINISSADLKDGEYRVFNYANTAVSVILDENRFALKPGQNTLVRNPKWHNEPMAFDIQIATVKNNEVKPVFSSVLEHYPKRRNLFFLFDGSETTSPIVFVNFDAYFPPPVKVNAKTGTDAP
jgi:hypothetical protein